MLQAWLNRAVKCNQGKVVGGVAAFEALAAEDLPWEPESILECASACQFETCQTGPIKSVVFYILVQPNHMWGESTSGKRHVNARRLWLIR